MQCAHSGKENIHTEHVYCCAHHAKGLFSALYALRDKLCILKSVLADSIHTLSRTLCFMYIPRHCTSPLIPCVSGSPECYIRSINCSIYCQTHSVSSQASLLDHGYEEQKTAVHLHCCDRGQVTEMPHTDKLGPGQCHLMPFSVVDSDNTQCTTWGKG